MKLKAPPFGDIIASYSKEASHRMDSQERAAFIEAWPQSWPAYREILEKLFSDYDHSNLLEKNPIRVLIEKLRPNKKINYGADRLLRFSFDDTGITWDVFQKGTTIVHAQPVF